MSVALCNSITTNRYTHVYRYTKSSHFLSLWIKIKSDSSKWLTIGASVATGNIPSPVDGGVVLFVNCRTPLEWSFFSTVTTERALVRSILAPLVLVEPSDPSPLETVSNLMLNISSTSGMSSSLTVIVNVWIDKKYIYIYSVNCIYRHDVKGN